MSTVDSEKEKLSLTWGIFILTFISICYLHAMHACQCKKKAEGMGMYAIRGNDQTWYGGFRDSMGDLPAVEHPWWSDPNFVNDNNSDLGWGYTAGSQLRHMGVRDDPGSKDTTYSGKYDLLPYSAFIGKDSFLAGNNPPRIWDPSSFAAGATGVGVTLGPDGRQIGPKIKAPPVKNATKENSQGGATGVGVTLGPDGRQIKEKESMSALVKESALAEIAQRES